MICIAHPVSLVEILNFCSRRAYGFFNMLKCLV